MRKYVLITLSVSLSALAWLWSIQPDSAASSSPQALSSASAAPATKPVPDIASYKGAGSVGALFDPVKSTREADVVLVGTVTEVQDGGTTTIEINGHPVEVLTKIAMVTADRYIKGDAGVVVSVEYYVTKDVEIESVSLARGNAGLLFLKALANQRYAVADLRYSMIPASRVAPARGGNDSESDRILAEVFQYAASPETPPEDRKTAMLMVNSALRSADVRSAWNRVRSLVRSSSPVRLEAAAILLEHNDLTGLDMIADAMTQQTLNPSDNTVRWLGTALSDGVTDKAAIPALTRLLQSPSPEIREGASNALRHTEAQEALAPLEPIALEDSEPMVRYNAVIGLALITGLTEYGPSVRVFQADEQKYLEHWRQWRAANLPQ